jgi:hypothetical protein
VRFIRLTRENRPVWGPRIQTLEASAVYPLGADTFRIDHGADYFAFFERLGEVRYYVAAEDERPLAVGCGAVRRFPFAGGKVRDAWYLCDLKVEPGHRGRRIPLRMAGRAFLPGYWRCARGFGITMNPPRGENRVVRLASRFRWARFSIAGTLRLWSLDADAMRRVLPVVVRHRGPTGFISLGGVKDLVLGSTGAPMPLLHAQFGPLATPKIREPQAGHVHMLCAVEGDSLSRDLAASGATPSATATVVHHRMDGARWDAVLTSDI